METETKPPEITVEKVEETKNKIKDELLKVSFEIYALIEKKEFVSKEILLEQKQLEHQLRVFTSALNSIKKSAAGGVSAFSIMQKQITDIANLMPQLQQKLT